ncbi:MAG TPA: hypothetical protein VJ749_11280 [Pyrinomonadaceae bacterium]|nr:hypothetical protein [Pyrinomonadaceae bacterium]
MKVNYSSKKLGGYILALFLILGFTTIASTSVQAQWRDRDRDDRYQRDRDDRYQRDRDDRYQRDRDYRNRDYRNGRNGYGYGYENARQQGYSYGMNVGAADAQRGQNYNPQRSHYWKDGDAGYNSSYGNRGQYRQIFRSAFEQGYREGYQQYGGRGRYDRRNNSRWGRIWPY